MTQEAATAQRIIEKLKRGLQREAAMRTRLEELRAARREHLIITLLPAERTYREAERVDFGFDVAITELERAMGKEEATPS